MPDLVVPLGDAILNPKRWLITGVALCAVTGLFFACFEKREVDVPRALSGGALINPYYAAGHFMEGMGAEVAMQTPGNGAAEIPAQGVLVAHAGRLCDCDEQALRDFMETGGHLIVLDIPLAEANPPLLEAAGISLLASDASGDADIQATQCDDTEIQTISVPGRADPLEVEVVPGFAIQHPEAEAEGFEPNPFFFSRRFGLGWLSVSSDDQFLRDRGLRNSDNAEWFWRFAMRPAPDESPTYRSIHFAPPHRFGVLPDSPSLVQLVAQAAPAAGFSCLLLVGAWSWRASRRFGPELADEAPCRRSIREHLVAVGQFLWRHDRGASMVEATQKRIDRQMTRRFARWRSLRTGERRSELAKLTGLSAHEVAQAMGEEPLAADPFTTQIQLLERLRRSL